MNAIELVKKEGVWREETLPVKASRRRVVKTQPKQEVYYELQQPRTIDDVRIMTLLLMGLWFFMGSMFGMPGIILGGIPMLIYSSRILSNFMKSAYREFTR